MGYDAHATAVVGVRLERDQLYKNVRVRGCEHPISAPDDAEAEGDCGSRTCCLPEKTFCGQCGKPTWETERVPIEGYDEDDNLGELNVVVSNPDPDHDKWAYVGLRVAVAGQRLPFLPMARPTVWGVLDPLGLWDEAEFGTWVILEESY